MDLKFKTLAALITAGTFFHGASAAEKGLLFYASFDNKFNADFAVGNPNGKVQGAADGYFTEGVKNQGLKIGFDQTNRQRTVSFSGVKNISPEAGTIMFYFKPESWQNNPDKYQHILYAGGKRTDGKAKGLYCYRTPKHRLTFAENESGQSPAILTDNWQDSRWHHYAVTWKSGDHIRLYIDGQPSAVSKCSPRDTADFTSLIIGGLNWKGYTGGSTVIDELKIYDHILPVKNIQNAAAQRPLPIGKDGRIFACSFDSGMDADFAIGIAKGKLSADIKEMTAAGKKGNALMTGWSNSGKRLTIDFDAPFNINSDCGTLVFCFKPVNWQQTTSKFHHLVSLSGKGSRGLLLFCDTQNKLIVYNNRKTLGGLPASSFKDNIWYTCALVWDSKNVQLYLDGKQVINAPRNGSEPWLKITFGALNWTKSACSGNTIIDEISIFNRVLTGQEISALVK